MKNKPWIISKLDDKIINDSIKDFDIIDQNYEKIKDDRMVLIMSCVQYEIQQVLSDKQKNYLIH